MNRVEDVGLADAVRPCDTGAGTEFDRKLHEVLEAIGFQTRQHETIATPRPSERQSWRTNSLSSSLSIARRFWVVAGPTDPRRTRSRREQVFRRISDALAVVYIDALIAVVWADIVSVSGATVGWLAAGGNQ